MHKKEHHDKHSTDSSNPFWEENFNEEEQPKTDEATECATQEETNGAFDKVKEDLDNLNNQYIRLAADFDNYRKRQAQERESLLKYGTEETLKKLIEVLDNFDRANQSINDIEDPAKLKETFDILHKQFVESLIKLGLEPIEAQGSEFDPAFHEAVMQTPTSEYPENTVIKELQKGYKLGDKVLRAALVDVAVQ